MANKSPNFETRKMLEAFGEAISLREKTQEKSDKLTAELLDICDKMEKCISDIRFQNWPTEGLGVGLRAETLDELLIDAGHVINRANAFLRARRKSKNVQGKQTRR